MEIYNRTAYNCTASDLDARYERRTINMERECKFSCSTCMHSLSLANTDSFADALITWCQRERKEK